MGQKKQRLQIRKILSPELLGKEDFSDLEDLLAELVARVYIADHSGQSLETNSLTGGITDSGPSTAAAAVEGAPPSNGGGPDH